MLSSLQTLTDNQYAVTSRLDPAQRAKLGQFMTPGTIAEFMASLFQQWPERVVLLDPGAGMGALTKAFSDRFAEKSPKGSRLDICAYEIEPKLIEHLDAALHRMQNAGSALDRRIGYEVRNMDFVADGAFGHAFGERRFTHAILNPPYKKIGARSEHRALLRKSGIEVGNLYAAFLALAVALTKPGGEIVAIVPRSFCNGTYFRRFRAWLLERASIGQVHVFESRNRAFSEDKVLQENIIVRLVVGGEQGRVVVSSSFDRELNDYSERTVPFSDLVRPADPERFIHIPTVETDAGQDLFSCSLAELGLDVATGPIVDFRLRKHLSKEPTEDTAPLLYAQHFRGGALTWPREHKKANAIEINDDTRKWLMPRGWYVITKRFTAKEERRRVVAFCLDPRKLPSELFGFENHLNVVHANREGLDPGIAHGLTLFLNSTPVDQYFRSFSGHTQVNATDLRNMRFPDRDTLGAWGKWARRQRVFTQEKIDSFISSYGSDE